MKAPLILLVLAFSPLALAKGKLLLIGGGSRPPVIIKEIMALSAGNVLIVPLASEVPQDTADGIKRQLEAAGATEATVFSCDHLKKDLPECLQEIQQAKLIFFTGGSQNRLMSGFAGTKSLELIRQRFEQGLHLSGTSAGTAIMSEVMITGDAMAPHTNFDGIKPNMVETKRGFGFLKSMIIDQHFLKRSRQNRLTSAVLDRPHLIGVGVDEGTAILVNEDESFKVIGESAVMVIDARKADISVRSGHYQAKNLKVDVLLNGQDFGL